MNAHDADGADRRGDDETDKHSLVEIRPEFHLRRFSSAWCLSVRRHHIRALSHPHVAAPNRAGPDARAFFVSMRVHDQPQIRSCPSSLKNPRRFLSQRGRG
jgi:hypothetical protein